VQSQLFRVQAAAGSAGTLRISRSRLGGHRSSYRLGVFRRPKRDSTNPASAGRGGAHSSPDRADALVWAFTELLVEEIA
jgi:phage terminase large subunit-like protein